MNAQIESYAVGTLGLTVVLLVAAGLSFSRPPVGDAAALARLRLVAVLAISAQLLHFCEESSTAFYLRFPARLGLEPWTPTFFVTFNVAWLAIWAGAVAAIGTRTRIALLPLWFLALASVLNGIAHPLLALAAGGYFPGLYTSPLTGLLGALLLHRLIGATGTDRPAA